MLDFLKKDKIVSTKPISILFLIISKSKVDYYADFLQNYQINYQLSFIASGTTHESFFADETARKTVIMAFILDENIKSCLSALEEQFKSSKEKKGVAYTVPLSSIIGVNLYNFLSNNKPSLI